MMSSFQYRMFAMRPYRNTNSSTRMRHLGYHCIPEWEKTVPKDPFDYPLRTKDEVMNDHKYHDPDFPITVELKKYAGGDQREHVKDLYDNRGVVAKIRLDMRTLNLAPLQRERFCFLLGPRYNPQKPFHVKIVTKQYPTYMENFARANETLRELYWEALRAPTVNALFKRNPYRREKILKHHFGRTKEERVANKKLVKN